MTNMKSTVLQIIGVFAVLLLALLAYMLPSFGISRWWIGGPIAVFVGVLYAIGIITRIKNR